MKLKYKNDIEIDLSEEQLDKLLRMFSQDENSLFFESMEDANKDSTQRKINSFIYGYKNKELNKSLIELKNYFNVPTLVEKRKQAVSSALANLNEDEFKLISEILEKLKDPKIDLLMKDESPSNEGLPSIFAELDAYDAVNKVANDVSPKVEGASAEEGAVKEKGAAKVSKEVDEEKGKKTVENNEQYRLASAKMPELAPEDIAPYLNQPKGIFGSLQADQAADVSKTWGDSQDFKQILIDVMCIDKDSYEVVNDNKYILKPTEIATLNGDVQTAIAEMGNERAKSATLYVPVNVGQNHWTLATVAIVNGVSTNIKTWDPLVEGIQKDGFRCMDYVIQEILKQKFKENYPTSPQLADIMHASEADLRPAIVKQINKQIAIANQLFNEPELSSSASSSASASDVASASTSASALDEASVLDLNSDIFAVENLSAAPSILDTDLLPASSSPITSGHKLQDIVSPASPKVAAKVSQVKSDPKNIFYFGDAAKIIPFNDVSNVLSNIFQTNPIQRAGQLKSGMGDGVSPLIEKDQARIIEQSIALPKSKEATLVTVQTIDPVSHSCRSDFHGDLDKLAKLPRTKKSLVGESIPHDDMIDYAFKQIKNHIAISMKSDGTIPPMRATGSMPKAFLETLMLCSKELGVSISNYTFEKIKMSDKQRAFFQEHCKDRINDELDELSQLRGNAPAPVQPVKKPAPAAPVKPPSPVKPAPAAPVKPPSPAKSASAAPIKSPPPVNKPAPAAPLKAPLSAHKSAPSSPLTSPPVSPANKGFFAPTEEKEGGKEGIYGKGYCRGAEVHIQNNANQAKIFLDQINVIYQEFKSKGKACPQVGLTYSANSGQTVNIEQIYNNKDKDKNWYTGTNGANQASVVHEIEKLLSQKEYQHLQAIFRILPISTCAGKHIVNTDGTTDAAVTGPTNGDQLKHDLEKIKDFAEKGIVLLWQNNGSNFTKEGKHFAVGGGVAGKSNFTDEHSNYVQSYLNQLYTAAKSNQPVPPVPDFPKAGLTPTN